MMRCSGPATLLMLIAVLCAQGGEATNAAKVVPASDAGSVARLEFGDGERIVLLGSALVERLQTHNYLETLIATRLPNRQITLRNLGWSGDTVQGIARAVFGTPEEGFARLLKDVREANPTLIIVAYGNNEAHEGLAALPAFEQQLQRLLDELSATGARLALITPRPYEAKGSPLPDPEPYNQVLAQYADVLRRVAAQRAVPVVDLLADAQSHPDLPVETTPDGVQLTERGYWVVSLRLAELLGLGPATWQLDYDASSGRYDAVNTSLQDVQCDPQRLRWVLLDRYLPPPFPPGAAKELAPADLFGTLRVRGLESGRYQLLIDQVPVLEADAQQWAAGCSLPLRGGHEQVAQLRQVINEKNQLYFHRYRPQNETYLFLFRKHEQGNNAVEIPQFEPLVAQLEQQIASLRMPQKHTYELVRVR